MDQALLDGGYRCYTGENIDVYFNTAICQHSKSWKKCVGKNEKLSHYAHLRNTNLIKYGSMMIFAVEKMICVRRK